MTTNKEIWDFRLELIGLILLLLGSCWQANFSGWWDKNVDEWQYWIQEEVNLAWLSSMDDVASLAVIEDVELRNRLVQQIEERNHRASSFAMQQRDKRKEAMRNG